MAQISVRPKVDPKCPVHPEHNVILRCKDCTGFPLVCLVCITQHEGHTFVRIQEGINLKLENIKQFIAKTETLTIPQLTKKISSVAKKKKKIADHFKSEIKTAREQSEQLKKLVDLQMTKTVSSLESEMEDAEKALDDHQKELERIKSKLKKMIESKPALTSGSTILIHDIEAEIAGKTEEFIPPTPTTSMQHFVPCAYPLPYIQRAFGDKTSQQIKKILGQPIQLDSFMTKVPSTICVVQNNMAWIHESTNIALTDNEGAALKKLTLDTEVNQVCLHPTTGDLYACCQSDNSVRRIHINMQSKITTETTVLFHTDSEPWSIACTRHNVIVGMDEKVCMYTYEGEVVYSKDIGCDFTCFCISVCNRTNRVAASCGYDGVLVLDDTLQELHSYKYTGEGAAALSVQREALGVFCAEFDDNGYLLYGDYHNKKVHILDEASNYRSTIQAKDMPAVWQLGAHDGVLWVGGQFTKEAGVHATVVRVKYTEN